jgi:hypothetical protein
VPSEDSRTAPGKSGRGVRAQDAVGKRKKLRVIELSVDPTRGIVGAQEKHAKGQAPVPRRSKSGKKVKIEDLLRELEEGNGEEIGDVRQGQGLQ